MKIIEKKTAELIPYARNPRKNDDAVNSVAASIKEFGFKQPIVIDAEGVVVAGHTRLKAAQKLGLETVPCVVASDLTPAQIKAYRLLDNKIAEKADWDFALLQVEIEDLADFDLEQFDVDWELPIDTTPLEDGAAAPALPEVAVSKLGDLWLMGEHRVLCGDCHDHAWTIDRGSCLLLTDPPYGVNEPTDRHARGRSNLTKSLDFDEMAGDGDKETAALICCSLGKWKSAIIWGANNFTTWLPPSEAWIVWDKRRDVAADDNSDAELAFTNLPRRAMRVFRHLWRGAIKDSEHGETRQHPTQKPVALLEYCIMEAVKYSEFEAIVDPFLGSGSTLIAAHKLNRRCFGLEISPRYVDVICQRFYNETGIIPVKEDGTKFPVDRNGLKEKSVKDTQTQE